MKKSKAACVLALTILVLTAAPGCGSSKTSPTAVPTETDSAITSFDAGSTESAPGSAVTADTSVGSSATMGQRNAAEKAKQYLEYTSFSRSGLVEQLEYEGFTSSQAEYGASAVGY